MILFNAVVQVFACPDPDRPGVNIDVLKPVRCVAGNDSFPVGLAAVDDDTLGPAMALQCFPKELLRFNPLQESVALDCADARKQGDKVYFEIRSVGQPGKGVIFNRRLVLLDDEEFGRPPRLHFVRTYFFGSHILISFPR